MTARNRPFTFVLFVLASVAVALAGNTTGPLTDTPGTWTGSSDVNWNNAANWSDNVIPISSNDVIIPTGCPRYPTTNSATAYKCRSLQIQSGASLTIVAGDSFFGDYYLVNRGTLTNNGHFYLGDSLVNYGTLTNNLSLDEVNELHNRGTFTSSGFLSVGDMFNYGTATLGSNADVGVLENYGEMTVNGSLSEPDVSNWGSFTNAGRCSLYTFGNDTTGMFVNNAGARFYVYDEVYNSGTFLNRGTLFAGYCENRDSLYNSGTFVTYDVEAYAIGNIHIPILVNDAGGLLRVLEESGCDDGRVVNRGTLRADGYFSAENLINEAVFRCSLSCDLSVDTLTNTDTIDLGPRAELEIGDRGVNNGYIRLGDGFYTDGEFSSGPGSTLHIDGDYDCEMYFSSHASFDTVRVTKTGPYGGVWVSADYGFSVASEVQVFGGEFGFDSWSDLTLGTAGAAGAVEVTGTGKFFPEGDSEKLAVLAAASPLHPYSFTVSPGAKVGAMWTRFSGMDDNGIRVMPGAFVDTIHCFIGCTFVGSGAGPMLNIEGDQYFNTHTISFYGSAPYNIAKPSGVGRVTVSGGFGNRWGENYDNDPNFKVDWFGTGHSATKWTELASVPGLKGVKDGGWLVPAGSGALAASGNKVGDVSGYFPTGDSWHRRAPIPDGREAKKPGKGGAACSDGGRYAWATKGNNTQGFWRYDMQGDSWSQKCDVPLGPSNKKVKGGTDLVDVRIDHSWYAFLLKGYKCEFLRYDPAGDTWHALPDAPPGAKGKWDKGSFLVWDQDHTIYAHKAKYHEFYAYDITTNTWSSALRGMPTTGSTGNKKSKDGGCGTWANGEIVAFKGGSTQECWIYAPGGGWYEFDTLPKQGRSGKSKKVKAGADIIYYEDGRTLYALKGSGTFEFWKHELPVMSPDPTVPREGVMSEAASLTANAMTVGPNPARSGLIHVLYSLPVAGQAEVRVFDAGGREVGARTFAAGRTGTVDLNLSVGAGVYLVRMTVRDWTATRKLVVQR